LEDPIPLLCSELVACNDADEAYTVAMALREAITERIEYLREKAQEIKRASSKLPHKK